MGVIHAMWRLTGGQRIISSFVCILVVVSIMAAGCGGNIHSSTPFFPSLSQPETVYPLGDTSGKLVLEDDCLLLKPVIGDSHVLVWPYGYSIETVGGEIQIIDDGGNVVASVGDTIKVGGGEISAETAEEVIGQPLPDDCVGPYWIVSEVIND